MCGWQLKLFDTLAIMGHVWASELLVRPTTGECPITPVRQLTSQNMTLRRMSAADQLRRVFSSLLYQVLYLLFFLVYLAWKTWRPSHEVRRQFSDSCASTLPLHRRYPLTLSRAELSTGYTLPPSSNLNF